MVTLKKIGIIFKVLFLSVFGTSKGLRDIESEMDFLLGRERDPSLNEKASEKPEALTKR